MIHVIFWQSIVSMHQMPYIVYLQRIKPNWQFTLVVENVLTTDRIAMGWNVPEFEDKNNLNIVSAPDENIIEKLLLSKNSVHVFEGIKGFKLGWRVFKLAIKKDILAIIVMSEAPDLRGIRSITRRLFSWFLERRYRKEIDLVFSIGQKSKDWYKWCEFNPNQLYEFCYVVEDKLFSQSIKTVQSDRGGYFEFVFIGSLLSLKGLDRLIHAFANIPNNQWHLSIFGEGKERSKIESLIITNNLQQNISLKGFKSNQEIREILMAFDTLILPSYYDGWGAVINEALTSGIPVICSDAAGASDLITNPLLGTVFSSQSTKSLEGAILLALKKGKPTIEQRKEIYHWAQENISGLSIANYFVEILEYYLENKVIPKPVAPWMQEKN